MTPAKTDSPRYQQQKLAAIRAAASVFAEKGFHGASTKDIAARLGIKQGSLYYYFDSKEAALEEVCLHGLRQYAANMQAIAESDHSFRAKLFEVVTNHLTSYRDKSEALKVFNDERLYLPAERRIKLHELGSGYREHLESMIAAGVERGELSDTIDAHFTALSIISICNGLGELIVRNDDVDVFDLVHKCTSLLLDGIASISSRPSTKE